MGITRVFVFNSKCRHCDGLYHPCVMSSVIAEKELRFRRAKCNALLLISALSLFRSWEASVLEDTEDPSPEVGQAFLRLWPVHL